MTRGQTLQKIKELGFDVKCINPNAYTATKSAVSFSATSPAGLLKQIKANSLK